MNKTFRKRREKEDENDEKDQGNEFLLAFNTIQKQKANVQYSTQHEKEEYAVQKQGIQIDDMPQSHDWQNAKRHADVLQIDGNVLLDDQWKLNYLKEMSKIKEEVSFILCLIFHRNLKKA